MEVNMLYYSKNRYRIGCLSFELPDGFALTYGSDTKIGKLMALLKSDEFMSHIFIEYFEKAENMCCIPENADTVSLNGFDGYRTVMDTPNVYSVSYFYPLSPCLIVITLENVRAETAAADLISGFCDSIKKEAAPI